MENELENVEDQTYWSHLGAIGLQSVRTEVDFLFGHISSVIRQVTIFMSIS